MKIPIKARQCLCRQKANETVSFLALAHGGFYKIRVNGVDGYVLCDKVVDKTLATPAPTENPTKVMYIVNANESVTLRKTPDQNGEQITTIPLGTQVEFVKKENDDFSKIKYGGQEGFVMTKYLTEDANIAIQQAGNKNAKPAEPVQHATGSSDVSVKFTMYVFNVQNSIYLRKYAEENSENICTIPWGEPVGYIEDVTNGFYKIKIQGTNRLCQSGIFDINRSSCLHRWKSDLSYFRSAKFGVFKKKHRQSRRNTFVKFLSERQLNISARTTDMIRLIITVWSDM